MGRTFVPSQEPKDQEIRAQFKIHSKNTNSNIFRINPEELEIKEGQDISHLGETEEICICPFKSGKLWERIPGGGVSVYDFGRYLLQLDTLLPWRFVLEECLEFGINRVGTGSWYHWHKGAWGVFEVFDWRKVIYLNPHLDRNEVAQVIGESHGIDIEPSEIYYWIWFHEIGHSVFNSTRAYANMQIEHFMRNCSYGQVKRARLKAEAEANDYANRCFTEWKLK